jgi:Tfp pilus assembly protein PilW
MKTLKGGGLIELFIALALASFMLVTLLRHYLECKKYYLTLQTAIEDDLELQMVTSLIRNSIRRAGFTPCLNIESLKTNYPIRAIEIENVPLPSLHINRMSEQFNTILHVIDAVSLMSSKDERLHREQTVLIADCYHAEVNHIAQVSSTSLGQWITLSKPLLFQYDASSYIGPWLEETYVFKKTLFYHAQHAEELTKALQGMENQREGSIVHTTLRLNRKKINLYTRIRT